MANLDLIRGSSAKCMVSYLSGQGPQGGEYPRDEGDLLRCFSALDTYPSLRADLPKMAEVNAYWAALVSKWDELELASHKGDMMAKILTPIQDADPSHVRLGNGVSVSIGKNTFPGDVPEAPAKKAPAKGDKLKGRIPMKETAADEDVRNNAYAVTADELRQFIERAEQLAAEKKDIAEQEKELFAEAKGRGYDTKVMRKVISLRKRKPDDISEEEAILDLYKSALGMI